MANERRDLYGAIKDVVAKETKYHLHYWGEVISNQDEFNRGRVQVSIPVLGWDTPVAAAWCESRMRYRTVVPEVGDTVEVYFLEGDVSQPVYIGQVRNIEGAIPGDFDGRATRRVLYDDPVTGDRLEYDTEAGELLFFSGGVKVLSHVDGALTFYEGTEALALGTTLKGYLDSLKSYVDTHTHTLVTAGSASSGPPAGPSPSVPTIESAEVFTN